MPPCARVTRGSCGSHQVRFSLFTIVFAILVALSLILTAIDALILPLS